MLERLRRAPARNADLMEMVRRGTAQIVYCTNDALVLYERVSGLVVMCAHGESAARTALAHLPRSEAYVAHGDVCAALVRDAMGCKIMQKCTQMCYLGDTPPAPVPGITMRTLDDTYTDAVFEQYRLTDDRSYVARRIAQGVVTGAFIDGRLAGFIGTHVEGSIGMLEVIPAFRRRGVGYALEVEAVRRAMREGRVPYCQVLDGNEPSIHLQHKLGMTFSDEPVYWLF